MLWNEITNCGMLLCSSFDLIDLSASGWGSETSSYFDEDDSEGVSSLLPSDGSTRRWAVSGTKHTVCYTDVL